MSLALLCPISYPNHCQATTFAQCIQFMALFPKITRDTNSMFSNLLAKCDTIYNQCVIRKITGKVSDCVDVWSSCRKTTREEWGKTLAGVAYLLLAC